MDQRPPVPRPPVPAADLAKWRESNMQARVAKLEADLRMCLNPTNRSSISSLLQDSILPSLRLEQGLIIDDKPPPGKSRRKYILMMNVLEELAPASLEEMDNKEIQRVYAKFGIGLSYNAKDHTITVTRDGKTVAINTAPVKFRTNNRYYYYEDNYFVDDNFSPDLRYVLGALMVADPETLGDAAETGIYAGTSLLENQCTISGIALPGKTLQEKAIGAPVTGDCQPNRLYVVPRETARQMPSSTAGSPDSAISPAAVIIQSIMS